MRTMRCFTLPIAGAERDHVHHPRRTLPDGVEDDGRVSCRRHVVDAYLISPPPQTSAQRTAFRPPPARLVPSSGASGEFESSAPSLHRGVKRTDHHAAFCTRHSRRIRSSRRRTPPAVRALLSWRDLLVSSCADACPSAPAISRLAGHARHPRSQCVVCDASAGNESFAARASSPMPRRRTPSQSTSWASSSPCSCRRRRGALEPHISRTSSWITLESLQAHARVAQRRGRELPALHQPQDCRGKCVPLARGERWRRTSLFCPPADTRFVQSGRRRRRRRWSWRRARRRLGPCPRPSEEA